MGILCDMCGLDNFGKICTNISKEFPFYRQMTGDGNSYYKAFIFAYLEYIILTKDIDRLNSLIVHFNDTLLQNLDLEIKEMSMDKTKSLNILFFIRNSLLVEDIPTAYNIFMKSIVFVPEFLMVIRIFYNIRRL